MSLACIKIFSCPQIKVFQLAASQTSVLEFISKKIPYYRMGNTYTLFVLNEINHNLHCQVTYEHTFFKSDSLSPHSSMDSGPTLTTPTTAPGVAAGAVSWVFNVTSDEDAVLGPARREEEG